MLFCGIDGGGTHTRCALIDDSGELLAEGTAGTSNASDIGTEASADAIMSALADAMAKAGKNEKPAALCAGIAGAMNQRDKLRDELKRRLPDAVITVGSDADNTLYAAHGGKNGAALICGTGCAVLAMRDGEVKLTSGWGYLIGDGGGFDIGRAALHRVLAAYDGRESECPILTEKITAALGGHPRDRIAEIYDGGKPYIAALVMPTVEAADLGDEAAKKIIDDDMRYVADCVKVGVRFSGVSEVRYTGGVLENACAVTALKSHLPGVVLKPLEISPQLAAARRAREIFSSPEGADVYRY